MNNARRKRLQSVIGRLSECSEELESIKDDEDEARENVPENLQAGDAYAASESAGDAMADAISDIESAINHIEEL